MRKNKKDIIYLSTKTDIEVDKEKLRKILSEFGIDTSTKNEQDYKLMLLNDDVNDMLHVVNALSDICKLSGEECVNVMMEAHLNGKAVAKTGSFEEMNEMKKSLNDRKIGATVEI